MEDLNWLVRQKVLYVAAKNLGYGETDNNAGPFIRALGGEQTAEWCATFVGYCYQRAYEMCKLELPITRTPGAKKLADRIGTLGFKSKNLALVLPGDIVCWDRGWGKGHIGIVKLVRGDGLIETIEGNVGKPPAAVKVLVHDVSKERLYTFAGIR